MHFPQEFLDKMRVLLGDQFPQFRYSLEEESERGLRVNCFGSPYKTFSTCLRGLWSQFLGHGLAYYREDDRPGRHPYHDAGRTIFKNPVPWPQPKSWRLNQENGY